jgi:hypothetical protein
MAMRGLTQFIGDVRNCTNKEEEVCGCAEKGCMGCVPALMLLDYEGFESHHDSDLRYVRHSRLRPNAIFF